MPGTLIDQLARARGVGEAYHTYRGELRHFSLETKRAILAAMGCEVDDPEAVRRELERIDVERTSALLPPVAIVRGEHRSVTVNVAADALDATLRWRLTLEDGAVREGAARAADLQETARHDVSGRQWTQRLLALPPDLPLGR